MAKNKDNEKAPKQGETPEEILAEAVGEPGESGGAPEKKPEPTPEELIKAEKDKFLRLAAEYDNYRKRSAKERESIYNDVRADTVTKFLPVFDNLTRALEQSTTDEAYRRGVELIMAQFKEILHGFGVSEIESVGKTFDPALHDAVMHIDDPERGESEIVMEFQKGFKLGDKVIRFSAVQVAN